MSELRKALYANNPVTCDLIQSIVELARPQRDGKPLASIRNFNFDALIEENLERNNVKYCTIFKEGLRNKPNEIPIYRVHGFLPREGYPSEYAEVVFSEDVYHTQFTEPFSWSNLTQLNKLSKNTCLLIGISLTDLNLRILLDVGIRKDPTRKMNHFIIRKLSKYTHTQNEADELLMFLEEQDSNELGLNVIWIDNYSEIGELLRSIST